MNASSFLADHIDTSKLAVFGHSQGGSAAAQVLLDDERVVAAMNVDSVQWRLIIDILMAKPFGLLSSDWKADHPDFNKHIYRNGSTSDFYNAKILKSGHVSFMGIPLMLRMPGVNASGSIDPNKGHRLSLALILHFFDKLLLNISSSLLEFDKRYTELDIERIEKNQ
jgi:pimeloyl-ACP methyl ester carboxylesterase